MDQSGKVANPARGQLNRENGYFPVFPFAPENLVSRVRPSILPVSARSLSTLRLNLVLSYSRDSSRVPRRRPFIIYHHTPLGQSRAYGVTQLRTDGVHCREYAGTGPGVFKVVPVTGAASAGHHGPVIVRLSFPTPTIGIKWAH